MLVRHVSAFLHGRTPTVRVEVLRAFKTLIVEDDGDLIAISAATLAQLEDIAHKILSQIQDIQSPRAPESDERLDGVQIGGEL